MNPDGFERSALGFVASIPNVLFGTGTTARRRVNANFVDLNRDFPGAIEYKKAIKNGGKVGNIESGRQPETL
jgi:hypothetical protein